MWGILAQAVSRAKPVLWAYLPLLVSALILAVATRPGSHPLLGLIALIPLFSTIHSASPIAALFRGTVWGAAVAAFLSIGLGESVLHQSALAVLPLLVGLYTAGGAALTRWIGFSPFVLGVGWIGVELVLGLLGLQLGLLAATQTDGWLMDRVGLLLGYSLVAFVAAIVNAALVAALERVHAMAGQRGLLVSSAEPQFLMTQATAFIYVCFFKSLNHARAPPIVRRVD